MRFYLTNRVGYMRDFRQFQYSVSDIKRLSCGEPQKGMDGVLYFVSDNRSGFTLEDNATYLSGVFSFGQHNMMHHIVKKAEQVSIALCQRSLSLDCYQPLVRLYAAQGFEEMSSEPFDSKPIPAGWTQSMGNPTIHHMVKHLP